jgi:hypothetical protein
MANVEEAQDLKRLRQTPPPTVETAVASPLPVPTKAHVNRNANTFDKQEEWKSNLRCVSAGAGCLGAAGVPSLWRRHVTRRHRRGVRGLGVQGWSASQRASLAWAAATVLYLCILGRTCAAQHSVVQPGGAFGSRRPGRDTLPTRCPPATAAAAAATLAMQGRRGAGERPRGGAPRLVVDRAQACGGHPRRAARRHPHQPAHAQPGQLHPAAGTGLF